MAADWVLIGCLKALFAEFNRIAPNRSHLHDGSIGDRAHQDSVSDHNPDETGTVPVHDADRVNEVHAIDVDNQLRESDLTMEKVVQFLLARCRAGTEKRLRYIIYNRRIWSASSNWVQRTYTGASPHTGHAHLSASYDPKLEASTASWHLEDIPVALTADDKKWITNQIRAEATTAAAAAVNALTQNVGDAIEQAFKQAVTPVAFAKGGGQHAPVGDAMLNSSYPARKNPDGTEAVRTLVWQNLQNIQTDLTTLLERTEPVS